MRLSSMNIRCKGEEIMKNFWSTAILLVLLLFISGCSKDNNQESKVLNSTTQVSENNMSESSSDSTENSVTLFSEESSSSLEQDLISEENKSELKQQLLVILQEQFDSTLKVTLVDELSLYKLSPKDDDTQFVIELGRMLRGSDSSSWYEMKDTLIGLSKDLSETLEEEISFSLSYDDSTDGNILLLVRDGRELYDEFHEKLVENGYK